MSRIACVLLLILCSAPARGADLPSGAVARLGDDRFRAGCGISHLALSPDGTRYVTAHRTESRRIVVTLWDADTGRRVHEHLVSDKLFVGFVWGTGGAFAVTRRATPGTKEKDAEVSPDDFCVWDFTDPKAAPPLVTLPRFVERTHSGLLGGPPLPAEYTAFDFSANGARLAARWRSADEKHAVHVFDLKPAAAVAKLTRVGTIDLGAEGADNVALSADGKTLVTARRLNDPERRVAREAVATVWPVAGGKPEKPVRVPAGERLMLAPDARSLVAFAADGKEWGFDVVPITMPYKSPPKKRQRVRWPLPHPEAEARDSGSGFAFFPTGEQFAVAADRGTLIIDTATGKELGRLEGHAAAPGVIAVSADGTRIATADEFGLVRLWDAKTFRARSEAPGHRAPVEHAELSPDGKRLLTWARDETVQLWDIATGTELRAFAGATGARDDTRPTFTADGTAIVYRTKDRLIARDLQTGLEVPLPSEPKRKPGSGALGPGPRQFAPPSDEGGNVVLREAATGAARRTLAGHRGEVRVLGFTPDGSKLLTAGGDHTVLVWDMRLQAVPLPDALKNETNAAKLWDTLATGKADAAYLAMARLGREPDAAVKMAKLRLKPALKGDSEAEEGKVADARTVELLEALATDDARAFLKALADGDGAAFRTREAKRALERSARTGYNPNAK